jgi:signal transduction histidine kinase/DNA-binding response OmpR family regulator
MPELFSKEHTILERPFMEFPPFGTNERGEKIRYVSGVVVRGNVDCLQECITRAAGAEVGERAVQELCRLLNERLRDPEYHVTPELLKNVWNSYGTEFISYLREFCVILSKDPMFSFNVGREQHIARWIQVLARPFPLSQLYEMFSYFMDKMGRGYAECEAVMVTNGRAILRRKFTAEAYQQMGPYRKRCAELACQAVKGAIVAVPKKVHDLPFFADVKDRTCIVNGDEWCEWEVTWPPQPRQPLMVPVSGLAIGTGAFTYLRAFHPAVSVVESLGVAVIPAIVSWAVTHLSLQARAAAREALITEQKEVMEARHEELREVYLEQEQSQIELRRKGRQIEELNVGLEAKVRERTAELERLNEALKTANEQLQELDHLKGEFFANISHEFRTPLTLSLASFRELWRLSPATKAKEQIAVGMRNTSRLLFLVNEFMDLAKFDQGVLTTKKLSIDCAALVRAVASNFESAERRRIHMRGADEPVPLEADPHQMKKVLYNLLSNAFKFSDPGTGEVWIRLGSKGDRVELEVEDNGIGIPRDQLGRIFERFAQVERGATRRQEGTGIGLALVKEIIAQHGGTITVESELGRGSTFVISLPRGAANADAMVAVEDENAMAGALLDQQPPLEQEAPVMVGRRVGGQRPLVLVADDNADMRTYIERLLKTQYRVALARDGVEALEQAKRQLPDLILTDVMMPRMCGNALLKAVRDDKNLRAIPVVFLTARAASEARVESLDAGADDYIAKPFDENEILARVNNLIRLRTQERELIELQKEKMTRFMPAQLADVIFSDRADEVLASHRAEITVVFIDLRGFTAFAETAEPEDVMTVLQEYQAEMGRLIASHHGVIERFSGDAIMIFFNDPVPVPNHAEQAIRLALAMRAGVVELKRKWARRGIDLGAGIGVAAGYATLGLVGFEQRKDYAAIGAVTNLAARLCGEARHGQILISERVRHFVKDLVHAEPVGTLTLKGFHKPVAAYNVAGLAELRPAAENGKTKKRKRG